VKHPIVLDWGMFGELALRLARELGECMYFSPWASSFPKPDQQLICTGLEDFGVTRVDFPLELLKEDDSSPTHWIFPDLYFTDLQALLRRLPPEFGDYGVWGSGWGELLELDRWKLHQVLQEAGCPVPKVERLIGVTRLEQRLRNEPETLFVKLAPYYRGLTETYQHRGWPASRTWFEETRAKLGPRGDTMPWMLQPPIPGERVVEPGMDLIIVDGEIQFPTLLGWERKAQGMISQVVDDLPDVLAKPIWTVVKALSGEAGPYTNFFSAELRVNEHGEAYFIDATCRMPRPGDGAHLELCDNLGAVITDDEPPVYRAKYACQLMLESPEAEKRSLHISFPEEYRDNIKLYWFFRDPDGEYWTLPNGITNVVSVVATGDDLEDVKRQALEIAESVKGDRLTYESNVFDLIEQDIEKGEANGIPW